jgi:sulfite reductase beta subunit-like hemoprotein
VTALLIGSSTQSDQDNFEEQLAEERKSLLQLKTRDEGQVARWNRQALARWDGLYARQQERLQMLGVPCFYATRDPGQIRKQQRVFDVLSALLE